jgi:hypothetical protein
MRLEKDCAIKSSRGGHDLGGGGWGGWDAEAEMCMKVTAAGVLIDNIRLWRSLVTRALREPS